MDVYDQMFDGFKSSANRIETLPVYHIEGSEWREFEQYSQGNPIEGFANEDWINQIETWKRAGKEISRLRVTPPVLSAYLRYELEWCYTRNLLAGEVIRFVSQDSYTQCINPETQGDFWMFDNTHVLRMKYDPQGHYLGEELLSQPELVKQYISLWTELRQRSLPYNEIMKQIRTASIKVAL